MSEPPKAADVRDLLKGLWRASLGLDDIARAAKDGFAESRVHRVDLSVTGWTDDGTYFAWVFFTSHRALQEAETNGARSEIIEFLTSAAARRRGVSADNISINFVFDSDERVQREFQGNYHAYFT